MKTKDINILIFTIILFSNNGCSHKVDPHATKFNVTYQELKNEFLSPPKEVKLSCYWWWLNSNITKECITQDLEAMKANGYGEALIFDACYPPNRNQEVEKGPTFLSDEWLELLTFAISEADRLDLDIALNITSGWNIGGPSVTPDHALKKITFSEKIVEGPGKINIELPLPPNQLMYKDIKIQAVRNYPKSYGDSLGIKHFKVKSLEERIGWRGIYPLHHLREEHIEPANALVESDIIDITSFWENGLLKWEVPDGNWTIIRYGMTNTGVIVARASEGWKYGLSLDHLSKEALLQYNEDVISKLIQTAKFAGSSLKFLHTDSWEMGVANWTDDFMEQFRKRRGYDMTPYLPVLTNRIVGNREISNRFLRDFRRTVADLVAEEHYEALTEIAHQNELYTRTESGGPHAAPIDGIQNMKYNDVLMGEFWARSNTHRVDNGDRVVVKQASSAAHIYGKRYVAAEGLTSIGPHWQRLPKDVKNVIDRAFCSGINRIVWQIYTASPDEFGEPGNAYFHGTQLNRHITWWHEAKTFINYINRTSSLLSQGLFKADALYYYGNNVPNFVFLKEEVTDVDFGYDGDKKEAFTDLDFGYDWDKCSYDVLMERVKIKNGRIVLPDGMSNSILVLPEDKAIMPELLQKLEELVKEGMVLIGPKPQIASGLKNYPQSDSIISKIALRMWGDVDGKQVVENTLGRGKVIWGKSPAEVLKSLGIQPDFGFRSNYSDTQLDYIHRYTASEDIFFIVNRLARHGINDTQYRYLTDLPDRYEEIICKFRVTGKVPELWDPMTGDIREINTYHEENGYTYIPLHFAPEGSVFVVFREKKQEPHIQKIERDNKVIFPNLNSSVSYFPNFDFYKKNQGIFSTVLYPGTYTLHWSNGSVSSFTSKDPFLEKEILPPWKLKFNRHWGPREEIILDSLVSWSDFPDEDIKYYSGSADYSNIFNLEADEIRNRKVYIDLGNVQEIASLTINGQEAGVSWLPPFLYDITEFIKEGKNDVIIKVTAPWVNRLIGDSYLPKEERFTRTNIPIFEQEDKEMHLRKSGLTSSVKIIIFKENQL